MQLQVAIPKEEGLNILALLYVTHMPKYTG